MKLKAYQVAEIVSGNVEGNDQVFIDSLAKIENALQDEMDLEQYSYILLIQAFHKDGQE